MACNFSINFSGNADALVETIKGKVLANKGTFNGDGSSGNLSIPIVGSGVSGSYTITGQQINIIIANKPFFVSCGQIQSYLEGNLVK